MASQSNTAVDNVLSEFIKDDSIESDIYAVRLGREEAFSLPEAKEYLFSSRLFKFQEAIKQKSLNTYDEVERNLIRLTKVNSNLSELIILEKEQQDNNNQINEVEIEYSKKLDFNDEIGKLITKTKELKNTLEEKIERSQNNIFMKMVYYLISIFKIDPETKILKVNKELVELEVKRKSIIRSITENKFNKSQ